MVIHVNRHEEMRVDVGGGHVDCGSCSRKS